MISKNATALPYIIETSWEVCNPVGGIYTVLSTKAKNLIERYGDQAFFIGPDLAKSGNSPYFTEDKQLLSSWRKQAKARGIPIRIGRWQIPGTPIVILVDHTPFFAEKDQLFGNMWNWFGVDSLQANGDYDESCVFAYAAARVIESFVQFQGDSKFPVIAHFDEWTTAMGLLYVKHQLPHVATVFTTHATCMGRSIAGNGKPLYDYLIGYNGDQMARELNMVAKHGVEKAAAHQADCFTTVSRITAQECTQLLERTPDVVTPNGFESNFVPKAAAFQKGRKEARGLLLKCAGALMGYTPPEDAFLVATSGRYEYRNKGIDLYIDALNRLRHAQPEREVIAFVLVPAWVGDPRSDLQSRMADSMPATTPLDSPFITHRLHDFNYDKVVDQIHYLNLNNTPQDRVKIIFVPAYLRGDDGIFNKNYYDLLIGFDATAFPSYYEPWGYTPLESVAFGVPTITTNLSGFGCWVSELPHPGVDKTGVAVLKRTDFNFEVVSEQLSEQLLQWSRLDAKAKSALNKSARSTAQKASWNKFFVDYDRAYLFALAQCEKRNTL